MLHSFQGGSDDAVPAGDLINVGGTLYGVTLQGGINGAPRNCCGTVFSIPPDGNENVLYAFQGGPSDGEYPAGPVLSYSGSLYGVTAQSGSGEVSACLSNGYDNCGTVFEVTP